MNLEPKVLSFLYSIIELLCEKPEVAKIDCKESKSKIQIEVYVHPQDVGRLLGKGGCVAKSIRNIGVAIGLTHKKRFRVIVLGLEKRCEDDEDDENKDLEKRKKRLLEIRGHARCG